MAGPIVGNNAILTMTFDGLYLNQQVMNTFAFQYDNTSSTSATLTELYDAVLDKVTELGGIGALYAAMFTADLTDIKVRLQFVYPTRYAAKVAFSNPSVGDREVSVIKLPPNLAAALTLRSFVAGSDAHGTKHILVMDQNDVADGVVQEDLRDLMQEFGDRMVTPLEATVGPGTAKFNPVILHRAAPAASQFAELAQVQTTARVMRRRTVGLGT